MPEEAFPYSENILHWVWEQRLYQHYGLESTCGKSIQVLNPGCLNTTDGPDFLDAQIQVGSTVWYGSVELHLNSSSWFLHEHHKDPGFNNVILHVVLDDKPQKVKCSNGSIPYSLNLSPYLDSNLREFLQHYFNSPELPCASNVHFIHPSVFEQQILKAHREYLEKKVQDFFSLYDPELKLSEAWKHALVISLFDGLGISHNRIPMQQLARIYLKMWKERSVISSEEIRELAFGRHSTIRWNRKSVRPEGQPEQRLRQADALFKTIIRTDLNQFIELSEPKALWEQLLKMSGLQNSGRLRILYGSVYLPSLYGLGALLAHTTLQQQVINLWERLHSPVPDFIRRAFTPIAQGSDQLKKLGVVHQFKTYCKPRHCLECLVLKKMIQG